MHRSELIPHILHELKHYLPAQAPLKDFIHHNTLHAFQELNFFEAAEKASNMFGAKTLLSLSEYRQLFNQNNIKSAVLNKIISHNYPEGESAMWLNRAVNKQYHEDRKSRIGQLRKMWKQHYLIDLDVHIQPLFFRVLCNYLDQGISIWKFPVNNHGFLATIKEITKKSAVDLFESPRAKQLLFSKDLSIEKLLQLVVGDSKYYQQYLFDQQFTHQGWSGMVSTIEDQPQTLLDKRKISLEEVIIFELLLEIDVLDKKFGEIWQPLSHCINTEPIDLFHIGESSELFHVLKIWQEAYEWTYYEMVLGGLQKAGGASQRVSNPSFQAMFCIDDRECSFRRYLEEYEPACQTFGTPGFFGVEFYYQPENGNFYTKVCPAPVSPKFIIKEKNGKSVAQKDLHFHKSSHQLFLGWLISQSLGFWSAVKLAWNIFMPSMSPATSYSFRHMDKMSELTIENENQACDENGLQIGFSAEEMAIRVENLLKSIGLVRQFSPIIYVVGHGSTSVNNTYYAGYDCGACSGRPGSVNARVFAFMANHPKVRQLLQKKNILIPKDTQFVGALRDTSRDTIVFYDVMRLSNENQRLHAIYEQSFFKASDDNAKERSRRFESINTHWSEKKIHEAVKERSVSLFEPRPEYNHATNALCIVGRRSLTKHLFLDRRSFLNSFDYTVDPEGKFLLNILNAVAPVCGGINLEYYFSRTDNQKFGAGTKLAHNVMGLIGVANGIDGDLRPGLPGQMIEIHDPIRLLVIVEHFPDVVLKTIKTNPATYQWFDNNWIHLVAIHPENKSVYRFENGNFVTYYPISQEIPEAIDIKSLVENNRDNIPVYILKEEGI